MDYSSIISSRFCEPAAIISLKSGKPEILDVNEKYIPELWMNVSRDDFISKYPDCCFDEDNMKIYLSGLQRCMDTWEEQVIETWRRVFSDCCGFDKVCLKSRLIPVEEGVVYEGITNISNEKRKLDILEDIEYRYKSASEQINIYNWEYDIATKEMRPCYRCMRDLGLPALVPNYPEPAIDMGIFPPDYANMYRDMMRKVDEGVPEIEADIPLTVGRIPFRVKYTTRFDEDGRPVKSFGSATLISETELGTIKLDNQIIAKLAEEYQAIYLIDFIKDSVKTVKQSDIFDFPKEADKSTIIAAVAAMIEDIPEDQRRDLGDSDALRERVFLKSDNREFVYKDESKDRWIRVDYHVIEKTEATVDRLLITASVVDDHRAEKMNADRLIAQQKEMLLEAIDVANKANTAKTEFFSNMSHDIRTPMNAITGFSRLAMDEIGDRVRVEDYLKKITSAGDHLMSLINDILDMSRIESGKLELSTEPVRISELLRECADIMRIRMEEKKLAFAVELHELGDEVVLCDKLRFNQVVLNLLSNACKYTPEGGSTCLSARITDRGDRITYEIRVRDTGIGMSEEFCKHIWEAFSREDTDIVRETQGTGLGMVIVRNIVNMMQGTIDLESKQGEGSEFIVTLPFERSDDGIRETRTEARIEEAMSRDYSGVNVLVVDDSPINLMVAERILGKYGFNVIRAESGVEAYQMLLDPETGRIDIILMDVMMPVMDGLETTRRIRAMEDERISHLPIIAMTANAFESDVKKAMDAGMDGYVPKPYKPEDVVPVIREQILRKEGLVL